jgi:hypothetical protein
MGSGSRGGSLGSGVSGPTTGARGTGNRAGAGQGANRASNQPARGGQGDRQANRGDRQTNRTDNRGDRQDGRTERQGNRQDGRTDRQGTRQENRTDRQGNRTDARGDRDFMSNNNINIDGDGDWGGWGGWSDYPLAAGIAIGAVAGITAAAYGSAYYALPGGCSPYAWSGYNYYHCGGAYYQPQYEGDTIVYVTVPDPAQGSTTTVVTTPP